MSTVLHVKIDEDLKKEAQAIAKKLGLSLSTVVAHGLQNFVDTKSITFSDEPRLKPEVQAEIEAIRATDAALSPEFENTEDALTWLKS